ncbi:MAG: LacI family DNA-binding transcriptional regulator, partial [Victivallales bacterium]|nr:LacI family DNA-binding transcriptional regulator [Victivallales bacterium]
MKSGNIKTIAEMCGVSPITVSRALRNNGLVKEMTRKHIIRTAEQLGYVRNPGRGRPAAAKTKKSLTVQLIVGLTGPRLTNFYSQLLIAVEQYLSEHDYDCIIRTCGNDYQQFLTLTEQVANSDAVANFIIGGFDPGQLKTLFNILPGTILLDNPGAAAIEIPYVSFSFDNVEAARIGVRHLFDCGRRRILLVGGMKEHFFTREIERGYREILEASAIPFDEKLVLYTDYTAESAHKAVAKALADNIQFDAVFTNDEMASGIYRALFERGFKVPGDVAVCGCDGLPVGDHLFPK